MALLETIRTFRVKPNTANEEEWGPFDIINGSESVNANIVAWRRSVPGAGGFIDPLGRGVVLLRGFLGGRPGAQIGFDRSRAVALIHEALHLQGFRDRDFEGSANLNTFIIQSCVNKRLTHDDLSIVVN